MKYQRVFKSKTYLALILGAATTLAMTSQTAEATGNRVWTLGGMNRFIEDDANRWLYPHTISNYSNLFYLEMYGLADSAVAVAPGSLRTASNSDSFLIPDFQPVQGSAAGGAIIKLMDGAFLSLHLSDYENDAVKSFLEDTFAPYAGGDPSAIGWIPSNPPPALEGANRKLDLMAAYDVVPDFLSVGLALSFGSSSYLYNPNDNDPPLYEGTDDESPRSTDNLGTSETRVLLSAGIDVSDAITAEVGFGYAHHGLTYLPNNNGELLNGGSGTELQLDARAMMGISEKWEIVPALTFRSLSFKAIDTSDFTSGLSYNNTAPERDQTRESTVELASSLFDLGVAGHYKPVEYVDFWLAAGMSIGSRKLSVIHVQFEDPNANPPIVRDLPLEEDVSTDGVVALPYIKSGIEARVFSWLDLRAGVIKYMISNKNSVSQIDDQANDSARNNDTTVDDPFFDYFLGMAAHYEGFFLDLQLDPEWIRRGPNFLSGASGNMFLNASLGYKF